MKYYVDTCIWLNFFKKEVNIATKVKYWEIVENFLEHVLSKNQEIFYSGIILRELQIKLGEEEFAKKRAFFEKVGFNKIEVINEDKIFARKLESK